MTQSLSLQQLIDCGLEKSAAAALLPKINRVSERFSGIQCWQHLTADILKPVHPFALHQLLYEVAYRDWDASLGPPPLWVPTPEQIQATHIATLMHQLELVSYAEFHAWSVRHRVEFWQRMIQRLGIRFRQPYAAMVDFERGMELPRWLVGSRFNIIESCFQAAKDAPAVVFQPEGGKLSRWSYGAMRALVNRVANGLMETGFQVGDAIAIDLPMTVEAVAIYLGIIAAGCVAISIADSFAPEEIATRLRLGTAKAIFTQDVIQRAGKQLPLYDKVVKADAPKAIVLASNGALSVKLRSQDLFWIDFLSNNDCFDAVPTAPDTTINILFSSGTTGDPKAIPWTQTTPIKAAADGHLHHDIHGGDAIAWPTNLGWMMGPWLIYASLINRATIALYGGAPTGREFGQFVQDAGVTMLGVVPSLVSTWKTSGCMAGLDWSAIKAFSSTGECSNPEDMHFLMMLAGYRPIVEYCGGTEIGGGYLTGTLVQACAPGTFTTPALGLDVTILDEANQLADKGELFIIPPSIGLSERLLNRDHHQVYFANTPSLPVAPDPAASGATHSIAFVDLSLPSMPFNTISLRRHGDRIERLPNGYYRALGRVDDTMNLGGIKVSAVEIEQVLNQVEGIGQAVAIAVSPKEGGPSRLVIYAIARPDSPVNPEGIETRLQSAIRHHLNPLFKIHQVKLVETLPRTASNKVMRRVLRDRATHQK